MSLDIYVGTKRYDNEDGMQFDIDFVQLAATYKMKDMGEID
jgi:hypothetical protein